MPSSDRSVSQGETYAFVHVLYQNALYESLSSARRAALSLRVAEALLERRHNNPNRSPPSWRSSMRQERDYRKAADWFLVAADNAAKVYANQQAVALCEKAVQQAEKLPDEVRRQLTLAATLKLGELHLTISELEAAADDFRQAAEIAEEAGLSGSADRRSVCCCTCRVRLQTHRKNTHARRTSPPFSESNELRLRDRFRGGCHRDAADVRRRCGGSRRSRRSGSTSSDGLGAHTDSPSCD